MIAIFGKRVYALSNRFSGISIISHLLSLFISFKYFFNQPWTVDVDYHLGIYSILFHIRLLYSFYRYRKYFYSEPNSENKWDLEEYVYDKISRSSTKILKDLDKCSICWKDYKDGESLMEFSCNAGHIFHKSCLAKWLEVSVTCPLCRTSIYDSSSSKLIALAQTHTQTHQNERRGYHHIHNSDEGLSGEETQALRPR